MNKTTNEPLTSEDWYLVFSTNLTPGFVTLTLVPVGPSRLLTTVNFAGRAEMGHYRTEVDAPRARELRALLHEADVASLPDPDPALPTTPFVYVGEGQVGARPDERRAFPVDAIPDALVPVVDAVTTLAMELMDHPYRAISGVAAPAIPRFVPGTDLVFNLTLENIGQAPLVLRNPAGARSQAELGLDLDISNGGGDAGAGSVARLRLGPSDVTLALPPDSTAPEAPSSEKELEPGESLQLRVSKPVLMLPGRYEAAFTYRSYLERPDVQRSVLGDLRVSAGTFGFGGDA